MYDETKQYDTAPVVTFSNIPLDDDPPAVISEPQTPVQVTVVDVQFKKGGKVYYFDPGELELTVGQDVIIETAKGPAFAYCCGGNHQVPSELVVQPLRSVIRIATDYDRESREHYRKRTPRALAVCQQKIQQHQLDMKLVSAEYSFDGSRLLFYFTADGRVDFRELVKDLASEFRTRIELRQIGVRDEAKLLGGLGICGRPFCCKQFLDDFQPVSIKMAKTQSLSLNPAKISGSCGRLMCCLKYEQDTYEALIRSSPKAESLVNTYDGVGTVSEVNILKQSVKVRLLNDPSKVVSCQNDEIQVLRNGKAKKNDPPVDVDIPPLPRPEPAEQAPITMFDETRLSNWSPEAENTGAHHSRKNSQTRAEDRIVTREIRQKSAGQEKKNKPRNNKRKYYRGGKKRNP